MACTVCRTLAQPLPKGTGNCFWLGRIQQKIPSFALKPMLRSTPQREHEMRLIRRLFSAAAAALVIVLAVASPSSAAWSTRTNFGSPGYVRGIDSMAVQGGICNNTEYMAFKCQTTGGQYDQIFVSNYIAYAAPYNVGQNIRSTAYLYYLNESTNQWTQYQYWTYQSCAAWPGQYCTFGYSSPTTGSAPWQPAFIDLPRGFRWTVAIKVDWYNYSTGQALASASYYPGTTSSDIGCAYWAYSHGRCIGPLNSSGIGYIYMP